MIDWSKYPNFSRHEFDTSGEPGTGDFMREHTLDKVQKTRNYYGKSIIISKNGGVRTYGSKDSSHYKDKGCAVDIQCSNSVDRFMLFLCLLKAGFTRIGVYDKHIHADDDPNKPPNVLWVGKSK